MKIKRTLPSIQEAIEQKNRLSREISDADASVAEEPNHIESLKNKDKTEERKLIEELKKNKRKIFSPAVGNVIKNNRANRQTSFFDYEPEQKDTMKEDEENESVGHLSFQKQKIGFKTANSFEPETGREGNSAMVKKYNTLPFDRSVSERQANNYRKPEPAIIISPAPNLQSESAKMLTERQFMKKMEHLQDMVKQLHSRVIKSAESENMRSPSPNSGYTSAALSRFQPQAHHANRFNDSETRRLILEMEQMKRCERIAKQNEKLYARLVGSMRASRSEFMDFDGNSYLSRSPGEVSEDVPSPLLLQENTKSAYFNFHRGF